MRTKLASLFILVSLSTTLFNAIAFGASKPSVNDVKAIACVLEDRESGRQDEIDRMPFRGIGGLWELDDKCKKAAREHAKRKELTDWRYLCCPITNDDIVHCESPLGNRGKW